MSILVDSRYRALICALGAGALGCETFSMRNSDAFLSSPGAAPDGAIATGGAPGFEAPTDARAPMQAAAPPPPITGGTLLVTADGKGAVVADPDRDRITFVDLERLVVAGTIQLEAGAMPGRLVEGTSGRAYGVLRGQGSVITLDRATAGEVERRSVCSTARGLAYDASRDRLLVGCAEGRLVEMPASGTPTRSVALQGDLRDVVVTARGVTVSRFRSAELISLDAELNPLQIQKLPTVRNFVHAGDFEGSDFAPAVAWRAIAANNGSIFVTHQRATSATIDLGLPGNGIESSYGGLTPCGGIVQTGFSEVTPEGRVITSAQQDGAVLPVDIAVAPDNSVVAIAVAGPRDPNAPNRFGFDMGFAPEATGAGPAPSVLIVPRELAVDPVIASGCTGSAPGGQPATAVAFNPVSGDLLVQVREPAELVVMTDVIGGGGTLTRVPLSGPAGVEAETRYDTGHELFHRAAGAALACASCHPEGTDDGRVWTFSGMGARRTQYLRVGLEGTAPFHWDGTLANLGALMEDVMVGRMGGAHQTPERNDALANWLFGMPSEPPVGAEASAAERGKVLFESKAACAACHSGPKLTNNETVDVGTGEALQVPSLVGVSLHPPFMHTGCAATLLDRFDPACGGKSHGNVAGLSSAEIADLVAYLQTL
jgi:mono/diheme cytochrome c family protein